MMGPMTGLWQPDAPDRSVAGHSNDRRYLPVVTEIGSVVGTDAPIVALGG